MKTNEISSSVLGTLGITLSVQDLTQVVNLILLILSVINILWVLASKVYKHIEKKEYDKVSDDINDAIQDIKDIKGDDKNG